MTIENTTPIPAAAEQPLYTYSLRNELRKLSQHALDALHMIHRGEPPGEHVPPEILAALPRAASASELAVEIAARNLIAAIGDHLA